MTDQNFSNEATAVLDPTAAAAQQAAFTEAATGEHFVAPATAAQPAAGQYAAPQYGAPQYAAPTGTGFPEYDANGYPIQPTALSYAQAPEQGKHAYAFAITSFVLGIASVVAGWTFIAPVVGIILGSIALRRNTSERSLALWGVWLNVAMLIFTALAVVLGIGAAAFGIFSGFASGIWF